MEPSSNMCILQPKTWDQIITANREPRKGQKKLWVAVAGGDTDVYSIVFPTGYGKSIAAVGAYGILRANGRANRMLILVPTDNQRKQWVRNAKEDFASLGLSFYGALAVTKRESDLRYAASGKAEVFVATYQQACIDPGFWDLITSSGKWFVVYDENHHLAHDGVWGSETDKLARSVSLYMTATPDRADGRVLSGGLGSHDGCGLFKTKPTVFVTIEDALQEEAIRALSAYVHHYFVDVEMSDGTTQRITTEVLAKSGVSSFSEYEAKYQLRYHEKYLSTILLDATKELSLKNLRHPGQHQMLVFAMTCRHAKSVCQMLNALMQQPGFADWVGSGPDGRRDDENDNVMDRYLSNELECLVQVDKAGEGFDNKRCSVLVFLHLIGSAPKNFQQIGRGVRRNHAIAFAEDYCAAFASADAPIVPLLKDFEERSSPAAREGIATVGSDTDGASLVKLATIPDLLIINSQLDRVEVFGRDTANDNEQAANFLRAHGIPNVDSIPKESLTPIYNMVRGAVAQTTPSSTSFASETEKINHYRERCKKASNVLAGNALKKRVNGSFEKSAFGDTLKCINSEWVRRSGKRHDAMMADDFIKKYKWLQEVNEQIKTNPVPGWLCL